jgi:hypothetical protein
MPDISIRHFIDQVLGVCLPLDTPRSVLLSKLDSMAVAARTV